MAKREFMCTYANCRKTVVPIVCTLPDERPRFCSVEHAAVAMVRRAWIESYGAKADALMDVERTLQKIVGLGD